MAYRMLTDRNGYMPEANGMVVAHVRKESEYALNSYTQYVPSPKTHGLYATIGRDQSVRMKSKEQFTWRDGADMPDGKEHKSVFTTSAYSCERNAIAWELGYGQMEQTELFKPKMLYMNEAMSRMMTMRSLYAVTKLTSTTVNSPWPATHMADATTLNGGRGPWSSASADPSDPTGLAIYRTLMAAYLQIHKDTNGRVKQQDVRVVISPEMAIDIAQSAELVNYVRETSEAVVILKDGFTKPERTNCWGLPTSGGKPVYRGFQIVVEDAVYVNEYVKEDSGATGFIEATTNRLYMWPTDKAVMLVRQGGLDGEYGQKAYSTYVIHHHGGLMRVKAQDDPYNEKIKGAVVEEIFADVPAPFSGFLISGLRAA